MAYSKFTIGKLTPFETACALGGSILGSFICAVVESKNQRNNTYLPFMESFFEDFGVTTYRWKETMQKSFIERCLRMMGLTCTGGILGFLSGMFFGLIWPILTIPLVTSIIGIGASYIKIEIAKK
jgi:hypothetical protein